MCNKNCGPGGTEACTCTCRCQRVAAFKSKNGTLYLSEEECCRHDRIYEQNLLTSKVRKIITDIAMPYPLHGDFNYHRSYHEEMAGANRCIEFLVRQWPLLLEKLNHVSK